MILPIKEKIKTLIKKEKLDSKSIVLSRLEGLSETDSLKESVQILTELKGSSSEFSHDYFATLLLISALNQKHLKSLRKARAKIKLSTKHIGDKIDQVVNPYNKILFDAYDALIQNAIQNKTSLFKNPDDLAKAICRLSYAAYEVMIWRFYDYQTTPENTWRSLNGAFQYAELNDLLHVPVTLSDYQEVTDFSTIFARALMLGTLEKSSFQPNEIRISAALIQMHVKGVMFEKVYHQDKHHYFTNLYDDKGACRIRAFDAKANYRYWSIRDFIAKIEDYLCDISTRKLPKDAPLRLLDSMPVSVRVLKKLNKEWSPRLYKRQRREANRQHVDKVIYVAHGLDDIYKQLTIFNRKSETQNNYLSIGSDDNFKEILSDDTNIGGLEKWRLIDQSESGFGVELGNAPNVWVEPGKLIGCQHPMHADQYVIAEIKTIKKHTNGKYRAGVEILSCVSQPLHLLDTNMLVTKEVATGFYLEDESAEFEHNNIACLYIPQSGTHGRYKSSVIMSVADYQANKVFKMESIDKSLELGGLIDVQQDWVRALVRII